jgi:predicted GIY-YIG superfamily endonuclease
MIYVYLLRSIGSPQQRYVGLTSDVRRRLREHNDGRSPHTSKYRPWRLIVYVAFSDRNRAIEFERYLKSSSGQAFAKRHLW